MKIDPNAPAYPTIETVNIGIQGPENGHVGLTILAEFTKAAMQGLVSAGEYGSNSTEDIAKHGVMLAKATIAELNKAK